VGVRYRADVADLDLRAVALVFGVAAADLEELALPPVALAGLKPGAVGPGHEGDGAAPVAEAAGVEQLALAGLALAAVGERQEEMAGLAGAHLPQTLDGRLGTGHGYGSHRDRRGPARHVGRRTIPLPALCQEPPPIASKFPTRNRSVRMGWC